MKNLIDFIYRISTLRNLLIVILIYLIFPAYLLKKAETTINHLTGKQTEIIDLGMSYNPERTLGLLHDYTPAAKAYYARVESSLDIAYPIVYAFLFSILLGVIYKKQSYHIPRWMVVLPFITLLFDYLENYAIYHLLTQYPTIDTSYVTLCEMAKLAKWWSLALIVLLILYGFIRRFTKK